MMKYGFGQRMFVGKNIIDFLIMQYFAIAFQAKHSHLEIMPRNIFFFPRHHNNMLSETRISISYSGHNDNDCQKTNTRTNL